MFPTKIGFLPKPLKSTNTCIVIPSLNREQWLLDNFINNFHEKLIEPLNDRLNGLDKVSVLLYLQNTPEALKKELLEAVEDKPAFHLVFIEVHEKTTMAKLRLEAADAALKIDDSITHIMMSDDDLWVYDNKDLIDHYVSLIRSDEYLSALAVFDVKPGIEFSLNRESFVDYDQDRDTKYRRYMNLIRFQCFPVLALESLKSSHYISIEDLYAVNNGEDLVLLTMLYVSLYIRFYSKASLLTVTGFYEMIHLSEPCLEVFDIFSRRFLDKVPDSHPLMSMLPSLKKEAMEKIRGYTIKETGFNIKKQTLNNSNLLSSKFPPILKNSGYPCLTEDCLNLYISAEAEKRKIKIRRDLERKNLNVDQHSIRGIGSSAIISTVAIDKDGRYYPDSFYKGVDLVAESHQKLCRKIGVDYLRMDKEFYDIFNKIDPSITARYSFEFIADYINLLLIKEALGLGYDSVGYIPGHLALSRKSPGHFKEIVYNTSRYGIPYISYSREIPDIDSYLIQNKDPEDLEQVRDKGARVGKPYVDMSDTLPGAPIIFLGSYDTSKELIEGWIDYYEEGFKKGKDFKGVDYLKEQTDYPLNSDCRVITVTPLDSFYIQYDSQLSSMFFLLQKKLTGGPNCLGALLHKNPLVLSSWHILLDTVACYIGLFGIEKDGLGDVPTISIPPEEAFRYREDFGLERPDL